MTYGISVYQDDLDGLWVAQEGDLMVTGNTIDEAVGLLLDAIDKDVSDCTEIEFDYLDLSKQNKPDTPESTRPAPVSGNYI